MFVCEDYCKYACSVFEAHWKQNLRTFLPLSKWLCRLVFNPLNPIQHFNRISQTNPTPSLLTNITQSLHNLTQIPSIINAFMHAETRSSTVTMRRQDESKREKQKAKQVDASTSSTPTAPLHLGHHLFPLLRIHNGAFFNNKSFLSKYVF